MLWIEACIKKETHVDIAWKEHMAISTSCPVSRIITSSLAKSSYFNATKQRLLGKIIPLFHPSIKAVRITTRPLNNGDTPNVKRNNGPIWLTQCCTQFKAFENKTFCFKYFHMNTTLSWKYNTQRLNLYLERFELGTTLSYLNWSMSVHLCISMQNNLTCCTKLMQKNKEEN